VLKLIFNKQIIVSFILILSNSDLFSQITAGGNSILKFGESKNEFHYSEVLLNMNLSNDYLETWFQFEYSKPPEIGMSINGLRKFRIDYSDGPFELSVGDIYKIWGRGLILNQFDDQDVNLDNGYRGLSFSIIKDNYTIDLISGISNIHRISQDYWQNIDQESRKPNHLSKHSMFGSDLEFFQGPFSLGLSFLQSRENHPINNPITMMADSINVIHRINGLRAGYEGGRLASYLELSGKNTLLSQSESQIYKENFNPYNGFSLFGNINYYFQSQLLDGWSLTMEYKNYNTTKLNTSDKDNFVKNYDMNLIFTQPPTVLREHSSVFLARLIPQVNFSDEVGYQFSLVGPIMGIGYFTLNYQAASRTNLWGKTYPDTVNAILSTKWESDSAVTVLPFSEKSGLPYNELYLEMEGYIKNIRYQFGFGITNKIPEYHSSYNSGKNGVWDNGEAFDDLNGNNIYDIGENFTDLYSIVNEKIDNKTVTAITIPSLLNYNLGNGWSIDLKYEFQKIKSGTKYYNSLSSDEVFYDSNGNGVWDIAELFEDSNGDGIWNQAEETWYDLWQSGLIPDEQLYYYDTDGDGLFSEGEYFTDADGNGMWNPSENLIDEDGDEIWDDSEYLEDLNNDGVWTKSGVYEDRYQSNFYSNDSKSGLSIPEDFQNNHLISLGIGKSPYWSLSLTVESSSTYEYGPLKNSVVNPLESFLGNIIDLNNKWIALEFMVNINSNTRLDLMYGTQRGGIICSNGICRYVEPFDDGFKLALSTVF